MHLICACHNICTLSPFPSQFTRARDVWLLSIAAQCQEWIINGNWFNEIESIRYEHERILNFKWNSSKFSSCLWWWWKSVSHSFAFNSTQFARSTLNKIQPKIWMAETLSEFDATLWCNVYSFPSISFYFILHFWLKSYAVYFQFYESRLCKQKISTLSAGKIQSYNVA